jgi:hypothetical protein
MSQWYFWVFCRLSSFPSFGGDRGGNYSSGSVQDFHLIPFSLPVPKFKKERVTPKFLTAKIRKKKRGKKVFGSFILKMPEIYVLGDDAFGFV